MPLLNSSRTDADNNLLLLQRSRYGSIYGILKKKFSQFLTVYEKIPRL